MVVMKYRYGGDRVRLLDNANLPYLATGRFALDILLGKNPSLVDAHEIYVEESDHSKWVEYLESQGARKTVELPSLKLIVRSSLRPLNNGPGRTVSLETLAEDIGLMCPRYFKAREEAVREIIPELYKLVMTLEPV